MLVEIVSNAKSNSNYFTIKPISIGPLQINAITAVAIAVLLCLGAVYLYVNRRSAAPQQPPAPPAAQPPRSRELPTKALSISAEPTQPQPALSAASAPAVSPPPLEPIASASTSSAPAADEPAASAAVAMAPQY